MACGIIVPRQWDIVGERDGYIAECIRKNHHHGPHVICTPSGKFFAWQEDWGCDCCEPEEDDRCYTYWEIKEEEVNRVSGP